MCYIPYKRHTSVQLLHINFNNLFNNFRCDENIKGLFNLNYRLHNVPCSISGRIYPTSQLKGNVIYDLCDQLY